VSRIEGKFAELRAAGRLALIPYLTVGYPDVATTIALASALVTAGADLIELGVPFSDPLADGATIQRASHAALSAGVTPRTCLEVAAAIRVLTDVPIILMGYYNPILRYGPEAFCRAAAAAGVDGLIVPDLPPEEAGELRAAADPSGLDIIFLLAPTATAERVATVSRAASGFIYCAALAGVTGARDSLAADLAAFTDRVRRQSDLPLAVGFGISRPEHVSALRGISDGAIVGSALIDRLESARPTERIDRAASYFATLRAAADGR
jgi:tryptophan synthase alpha chain